MDFFGLSIAANRSFSCLRSQIENLVYFGLGPKLTVLCLGMRNVLADWNSGPCLDFPREHKQMFHEILEVTSVRLFRVRLGAATDVMTSLFTCSKSLHLAIAQQTKQI
jgi:hypothetical protein